MIVLDTNVVSEVARIGGQPSVRLWIDSLPAVEVFVTAVTQAEVLYGINLLPAGRRREGLSDAARIMFDERFAGRILPFDSAAASPYADIAAKRRTVGRPIKAADAQIAAIVALHRAILATRNTADFEGCGIDLVDPWTF